VKNDYRNIYGKVYSDYSFFHPVSPVHLILAANIAEDFGVR
jgi:hypothetical protein